MRSIDEKIIDLMNRKTDEVIESNDPTVQKERQLERKGAGQVYTLIENDVEKLERLKRVLFKRLFDCTKPDSPKDREHNDESMLLRQILIEANLIDEFNEWFEENSKGVGDEQ